MGGKKRKSKMKEQVQGKRNEVRKGGRKESYLYDVKKKNEESGRG